MAKVDPFEVEQIMLAEARADVVFADQKASMILAALGIGFGAVLAGLIAGDWRPSQLAGAGEALWWVGAVAAIASLGCAAAAVWPRYSTKEAPQEISYWGHVAAFASVETFAAALDKTPVDRIHRTRHQLWRLSRIVRRKYRLVRASLSLTGIAVVFFLLASAAGG